MQLKFLVKNSNDPAVALYAINHLHTEGMQAGCLKNAVDKFREELTTHFVLLTSSREYVTKRRVESPIPEILKNEFQNPVKNREFVLQQIVKKQKDQLQKLMEDTMKKQMQSFIKQQQKQQMEMGSIWRELAKLDDDTLRHKLSDPNPFVRMLAIHTAGKKRLPVENEAIALLGDPNLPIRQAARQTLVRLGRGTDFGPEPNATAAQISQSVQNWNAWQKIQADAPAEIPRESIGK